MSAITTIKMGLLLARLKLGSIFTTDKTYPKDPNPENWRTINHAKVHLSNGKIDGGAGGKFQSNAWVGKEKHGNNSFFPLNQMYYGQKAKTNAKSAEVSSQAGAAGASQAKQAAKAASKSKAASAEAEGQTSAIAAMQEYMEKKKNPPSLKEPEKTEADKAMEELGQITKMSEMKAFEEKYGLSPGDGTALSIFLETGTPKEQVKGTFEKWQKEAKAAKEEPVPFGSPEPSNEPPEKVAKQLINKLQKKYADQPQEYKEAIDKALKALAKGDEEPMSHLLDADLTPKGQEQVWEQISTAAKLMKAKKITPLAAKNIVAAAIGNPGNPALVKLGEIWKTNPPDTTPKKKMGPIEELQAIEAAEILNKIKEDAADAWDYLMKEKGFSFEEAKIAIDGYFDNPDDLAKEIIKGILEQKAQPSFTPGKLVSAFTPEKIKKLESLSPAEKIAEWDKYNQMPDKIWFNQGAQYKQQEDAQKYFDPIVSKWHKKMTEHEKNAVEYYTGSGYGPINDMLRGVDTINPALVEKVKQIDNALNKLPDNTKTMSLRRGVYGNVLSLIKKAPNGIFVDQGYTSTSPCSKGGFNGTVDLEIIVPPGMGKMAWVDDISTHKGELELILPRGARYMVCDIDEGKSKPKVRLMLLGFEPQKIKKS